MGKNPVGCRSFLLNRQLGIIIKCDSTAHALKQILAATVLCLAGAGRVYAPSALPGRALELVICAWRWAQNDCRKALARRLSLARSGISGWCPVIVSDIRKKPGFYGGILAFMILAGTLCGLLCCLEQTRPEHDIQYIGEQATMAGSPQSVWQQIAREQGTVNLVALTGTACKLQVTEDVANVRSGPAKSETQIGQAYLGDIMLAKAETSDGWYQVAFRGGTGWIAGWCVQAYHSPGKTSSMVADSGQETAMREIPEATRGASSDLIGIARRFLGSPYSYGANGTASFDCSGFVRYVYACHGISLPRVASDQARAGVRVPLPAPGDLIFFSGDGRNGYITHVGIYVGNNSFIHASFSGVTITSLGDPWYKEHYVMACRVI